MTFSLPVLWLTHEGWGQIILSGLDFNKNILSNKITENNYIFFSESPSRIVVTVSAQNKNKFESFFKKNQLFLLGKVIDNKKIIFSMKEKKEFEVSIDSLNKKYKQDLFN